MTENIQKFRSIGLDAAIRDNALLIPTFSGLAILLVIFNFTKPMVFARIIDDGLSKGSWIDIQHSCLLFFGIAFALSICSSAHGILATIISNRASVTIKSFVLHRVFDLNYSLFQKMRTGDIVTRLSNDVERIESYLITILHVTMNSFLSFIAAMIYIGIVQWKMLIAGFVIVPFVGLCIYGFRRVIYQSSLVSQDAQSTCAESMFSGINNIIGLRQINLDHHTADKIAGRFQDLKRANIKHDVWSQINDSTLEFINAFGYIVTIGYGGWLVSEGSLTLGHLLAFLTLRSRFTAPLTFIERIYKGYYKTKASFNRIAEFYSYPKEEGIDIETTVKTMPSFERIEFKNLKFKYDSELVIDGLNLSFERGINGLYGNNGCGKTTLINILLKILSPDEGRILVDGVDVRLFNNREWREYISVVPQNTYLSNGSLKDNLRMGNQKVGEQEILEALWCVAFDKDLMRMSGGLKEMILEGGSNLSGGQRQKVALARSILTDRPIFILDEPLAHVDQESKKLIYSRIRRYMKKKIVIWISHDDLNGFYDHRHWLGKNGCLERIS